MPSLLNRVTRAIGHACAWGFLVIALMMGYEVIARYAFAAPTIWAHEIAGALAAVAFIVGGAYCMVDRSHMKIDLFSERLGPRARRAIELFSLACGVVYLGGLTLAMWPIATRALFRFSAEGLWRPERSGSSWNTPAPAFLKLALLIGAVLFLAVILLQAWLLLRRREQTDGEQRSD